MHDPMQHDLILVGGGLANGLIALRLALQRPELKILLVEKQDTLGGNHTWSFYRSDLTASQLAWLRPLIVRQWDGYDVKFPLHQRRLDTPCYSISAARFHALIMERLGACVVFNAVVSQVQPQSVRINGRVLRARAVVDGRGPAPSPHMRYAWQKFVGHELELAWPHNQARPVIMDAVVPQNEGYRFVYTLPFSPERILVEDTYYSTTPELDPETIRENIHAYAQGRGWRVARVLREETGVLPIVLDGDIEAFWNDKPEGLPCSGLRAGLFHATTGYSLPHAVRLADLIAEEIAKCGALDPATLSRRIRAFSTQQWRSQAFMRLLNRMLFFASAPAQRYKLLQRFYTLPQPLIERFYAGEVTLSDKLRILSGRPPVPVRAALKAMLTVGTPGATP